MRPTDFNSLANYCMQELGAPVIDIHVAEEQVVNRLEDAIDFFQEFHYDASERTYLKYQIRGNELQVSNSSAFIPNDILTGSVSGAVIKVINIKDSQTLNVGKVVGTFINGETITGSLSGANAVVGTYTVGDIENGYIPVSLAVTGVTKVFPYGLASGSSNNQFSIQYQIRLEDIYALQSSEVSDYTRMREHLSTLDFLLTGEKQFRFNKKQGRIYIDTDWKNEMRPGQYILVECFRVLDPVQYGSMFNDRMLKKLATAYVKKQWGSNMKLHSGIQLPGGVTISGQAIFDEAMQEIKEIEQEIKDTYMEPPMMISG